MGLNLIFMNQPQSLASSEEVSLQKPRGFPAFPWVVNALEHTEIVYITVLSYMFSSSLLFLTILRKQLMRNY